MRHAVTFDFWDTIVADDSDEPKRAAAGLATKKVARRQLFVDEVRAHHALSAEDADAAYDHLQATFRHHWKVEHHTPSVADRLQAGYDHLGIPRTPGFDAMVAAYETMEVDLPPELAPGIAAALQALHGRYPLGIISDAIVTPGVGLRRILERYELLQFFDVFIFSDEAGAAKPAPAVFHQAAKGFGVDVAGIVHIGDREANDIAGPVGVGAQGILYTGTIDRGTDETRAAGVCRHHDDLPALVESLCR